MDVTGKIAIVTGGGRGIGRGIVLALARNGADVVVADINAGDAGGVEDEAAAMGRRSMASHVDVTDQASVERMVRDVIDRFGHIDILVNNAGIHAAPGWEEREVNEDDWDVIYEVNVKGVARVTEAVAGHMKERRYGKIVNISSNSGFGIAMSGETSYAVSKAGVIQLTKSSALELGKHNINVNCVAPGAVDTVMLRGNRSDAEYENVLEGRRDAASLGITGTPEDIANAVLFFASDESRYITGKILLVDGGRRDFL